MSFLDSNTVSLLLMDINLGDKSGFDLCKKVREQYDMPILFISARTSDDEFIGEGTLAVHIRHLREKIEKDSKNPEIIKTIWGVGYILEA